MFMKSVAVGILALFAAAFSANAGEQIRFGIETSYPPFSDISPEGKIIGFDADIAHALCARLRAECVLVQSDWDALIPGLNANAFDAIIASVSITEERKKLVEFTNPYYSNKLQFVADKNEKFDASRLAGKTLGAQEGTIAAFWLQDHDKGVEIKLYGTQREAHAALSAGKLDAVLADIFVNWAWLATPAGNRFEPKGKPVLDHDKIAIALKKGDNELRKKLNGALQAIIDDREYQSINDRYFPFSIR
ncbi:amino acid ABC transporter substrate-binding protein [Alphaproteobacteria bacterium]|nr:amino acid ABC transporter substrate-binding protein [Alphaproteobacteria bacterium]